MDATRASRTVNFFVVFKNVARHTRDMCGVGVGWRGGVGRDNYKRCSCIQEDCETNVKRCGCFQEKCSTQRARARYVWCWGGGWWGGAG